MSQGQKNIIGENYEEGDFIDAKDNQGDWRVGYIVTKNTNTQFFKVRFDGWGSKYDEFYRFSSFKLQPFRTYVIGYTGQKQNPAIRQTWKFTLETAQQRINNLQELLDGKELSPHKLNQGIRGHNYFWVDFIMTSKLPDLESFTLILQYFKMNIDFLVQYLVKVQENFDKFLKIINSEKTIEEQTPQEAYFLAFYEVFDTIYTIFGNYDRLECFFKTNQPLMRQYLSLPANKDHKKYYRQEVSKHLLELKGMEAIDNLIKIINSRQEYVPFSFLSPFTHLIEGTVTIFVASFKESLLDNLLKIGQLNVSRLRDSQIKNLHRTDLTNFIEALIKISKGTKHAETIEQWATMLELSLSLKMILCPFFQRKLKGISHIIEVFERHETIISKNDQLKVWVKKSKLFETLFVLNDNLELTKKACELTRFLANRGLLIFQQIEIIWGSRTGKHETIIKEIYNLMGDLPYYEKETKQNLRLFGKISSIPKAEWDEDYIHMIKVFSHNSYGLNTKEHMAETFGFQMLVEYAVNHGTQFAINELVSLSNCFENSEIFTKFQAQCFTEISKKHKESTYVKILASIYKQNISTFEKVQLPLTVIITNHLIFSCNSKDREMLKDSLELLHGVVKSTPSKQIQVTAFIALWKAFKESQNSSLFVGWLQKKKDNGRVYLNHLLTDSLKKYMLSNTWSSNEDCTNVNEEEAILIIELFKHANENVQKIRKPHFLCVQALSTDLLGYETLWNIFKFTRDDQAAKVICEFLAQIFTSYEQKQMEQAINFHGNNLIQAIRKALSEGKKDWLLRLLTLMKKTIDFEDELLISRHSMKHHFMKQYSVHRKDTGDDLTIKFSCTSHYFDFKKFISSKIGVPMHRFYLVNSKGVRITREHFFKSLIEPPLAGVKFNLLLRNQKSIIKEAFNQYLDVLFNLLDNKATEKIVWNIVERLHISEEMKEKVSQSEDIFKDLSQMGFYKELYTLKVMLELGDKWWVKVAKSNSIDAILSSFKKITFKSQIEEQYFISQTEVILNVINVAKEMNPKTIPENTFSSLLTPFNTLLQAIESEGPKSIEAEQKIIANIFKIAQSIAESQQVLSQLLMNGYSEGIFRSILINIAQQELRKRFIQEFKGLLKFWDAEKDNQLLKLLLQKLFNNVVSSKNKDHLRQYFLLTSHVISKAPSQTVQKLYQNQVKGLVPKLYSLIQKQQPEQSGEHSNKALEGYLTIIKHFISLEDQKTQAEILEYLIKQCLFSEHEPKCKSSPSRREGFSVLLELCQKSQNVDAVLPYLSELHKRGKWRSRRIEDWGITLTDKQKSTTGYVGLKNLGCICYMNSFNQQLFMIPYFRYSISNAEDPMATSLKPEDNILHQIQKMFMNLEYSQKKYYSPKPFCHAFKDYEGNPTNVTEQMDIDEYSNMLFDKLETQLKGSQYTTLIQDMFGGVFSNEIVCKGCPHYSESEQPFLNISLTVKNKRTIQQSFDNMIKGDTLDGDNAYYCQRCAKKVSAVKRMSIKKLPNHLIVTLKRFEFDYERMMKLKVNDYCQFPQNLNLQQYSQQYLRRQQNSKTIDEQEQFGSDYYNYVLKGIVIHVGHADSGHYYSFIQDRLTNKWYEFNDTVVRDFDIADLAQEAFGGQTGVYDIKEKIKNAYMVIYERQKKIVTGRQIPFKREAIKKKEHNLPILKEILGDNRDFKLQNYLFSREYTRYLLAMLTKSEKQDPATEKKILHHALVYYLTVTVREKNEGLNQFILKRINKCMEKHHDLAEWALSLFSIDKIFDEFFLNNPYRQTRKTLAFWLSGLIKSSSLQISTYFCNFLVNRITTKGENNYESCLMLYEAAQASKDVLVHLLKNNILGRLFSNVTKEKGIFKDLLQTKPDNQSEIGYEESMERSMLEELKWKKIRQMQNENEYVWGITALFIEQAQKRGSNLQDLLPKQQLQCLQLPQNKIYKILEQMKTKFAIYSFSRYVSCLTVNNEELVKTVLNLIFSGLKEYQSKRYRQFFLLAQELIQVKDDLLSLRLECLKKIIEALKFNEQYSSDSNIIQQWIVILLNRNQSLRKYICQEVEMMEYLVGLTSKKVPSDQISKKNKKFNEAMINKLHGVKFLCSKRGYTKLAEQIKEFYHTLGNQNFEPSPIWPSIRDNYLQERKIQDKIAYFDAANKLEYEEGTITNMFLGKIELTHGKNRTYNVWKDDEKIMKDVPPASECQYSQGSSERLTDELEEEDTFNLEQI